MMVLGDLFSVRDTGYVYIVAQSLLLSSWSRKIS